MYVQGEVKADGHEWLFYPEEEGVWWYRAADGKTWMQSQ